MSLRSFQSHWKMSNINKKLNYNLKVNEELLKKGKGMEYVGILGEWRGWYMSAYGRVGKDGKMEET